MRKRLTAVALAGTVGLGAVAAGAIAYPALADNSSPTASPQVKPGDATAQKAAQERRTAAIRAALKGLVDDKTLTSAQADKVASTLGTDSAVRGRFGGPGGFAGPGGFGGRGGAGGPGGGGLLGVEGPEADAAAAKVLGLSVSDLQTALRSGSTLADLAKKQGKDVNTLISSLVTVAKQRLDAEVKAGRISQDTATQIEKTLQQRVQTVVQNGRPQFGGMPGGGMGRRWHEGQGQGARPGQTPPGQPGQPAKPGVPGTPAPVPSASGSASSSSSPSA